MYYNRTNKPGCQEKISAVLNILWQVSRPHYLFCKTYQHHFLLQVIYLHNFFKLTDCWTICGISFSEAGHIKIV